MTFLRYEERIAHCHHPLAKEILATAVKKQSNLALSADVTKAEELLLLADKIGPEILILKTHIDILQDFTPAVTTALQKLSRQHHFFIFEDRKFADIGNTVALQFGSGMYRMADWAHLINAHPLPGPGMVAGLAKIGLPLNRGLLLIAQMSSAGHLMDAEYQAKTLQLAKAHPEFVLGFITQHALSKDPGWLYFTPGIQLESGSDALGQQYTTPDEAIYQRNCDIIIVGRGIYAAKHQKNAAEQYRQAGWQSYLKRCP